MKTRNIYYSLLISALSLALPQWSLSQVSLSGRITDASGEPLIGAAVHLQGTQKGQMTDLEGGYSIKNIPEGIYTLEASFVGYRRESRRVDLRSGSGSIDFALEEDRAVIGEATVTAKSNVAKVQEKAYAVTAVDAKALQNLNLDINQTLNRTTGIRIREEGGLGSDFNFMLNGFSGKQIKFFIDGLPMSYFGSALTLNNFPINSIEQIEVYTGVVPVWIGADALGGAVNIITKRNKNSFVDAYYSVGSFNTHRVGVNAQHVNPKLGTYVKVNAFHNYSDNNYKVEADVIDWETRKITATPEVERFHDAYRSTGMNLEAGLYNKSFADELSLGIWVGDNYKEYQHGYIMREVFGRVHSTSQMLMPTLRYNKENLLLEGLDVKYFASYGKNEEARVDTSSRQYSWDGTYQVKSDSILGEANRQKAHFIFNDKMATSSFTARYSPGKLHRIDFNHTYTHYFRQGEDDVAIYPIPFEEPNVLDKHIFGLSYTLELFDGRWTNSLFAKKFLQKTESFYARYGDYEERNSTHDLGGFGVASTFRINDELRAKASFEETSRLPEFEEIFGNGLLIVNNPDLKPERSSNFNLGLLYNAVKGKHGLYASGNLLYRDAKDFIRPEPKIISQYVNLTDVLMRGVELDFRYDYNRTWFAGINGTYQYIVDSRDLMEGTDRENPTKGMQLPNIPYLFANANLGARFRDLWLENSNITINWFSNYVHEFYLYWPGNGAAASKNVIPTQLIHNVSIGYSIDNGRYNIELGCTNLADAKVYDNFRIQKPGRAFSLKLRYNFTKIDQ